MSLFWIISICAAEIFAIIAAYYHGRRDGHERGFNLGWEQYRKTLKAASAYNQATQKDPYASVAQAVFGAGQAPDSNKRSTSSGPEGSADRQSVAGEN